MSGLTKTPGYPGKPGSPCVEKVRWSAMRRLKPSSHSYIKLTEFHLGFHRLSSFNDALVFCFVLFCLLFFLNIKMLLFFSSIVECRDTIGVIQSISTSCELLKCFQWLRWVWISERTMSSPRLTSAEKESILQKWFICMECLQTNRTEQTSQTK